MVSALDHAAAAIEELIFHPFERNTDMRAAILVEINLALLFDGKELAIVQVETLAAILRNVRKRAEMKPIR